MANNFPFPVFESQAGGYNPYFNQSTCDLNYEAVNSGTVSNQANFTLSCGVQPGNNFFAFSMVRTNVMAGTISFSKFGLQVGNKIPVTYLGQGTSPFASVPNFPVLSLASCPAETAFTNLQVIPSAPTVVFVNGQGDTPQAVQGNPFSVDCDTITLQGSCYNYGNSTMTYKNAVGLCAFSL